MGDCIYCRKPAGFFKSRHRECELADIHAREEERAKAAAAARKLDSDRKEHEDFIRDRMLDTFLTVKNGGDLAAMETRLLDAIVEGKLSHPEMKEMLISAWEMSVDDFLDDGILEAEEEDKLVKLQERFALSQSVLDRSGKYMRVAKSAVLRKLLEGKTDIGVVADTQGMINLQKGEIALWIFNGVDHYADTLRRQTVGGSQGMSFRVMSGVYYRVGAFKGESVSTVERKLVDDGALVVTNQALYFLGRAKTTRFPYNKIVSFTPFSDAVGLMRDTATARPQIFKVDDPWFAFNLITNLAKIHSQS